MIPEEYPESIRQILAYLWTARIPNSYKSPKIYRVLWQRGLEIPPPIVADFLKNFIMMSIFSALLLLPFFLPYALIFLGHDVFYSLIFSLFFSVILTPIFGAAAAGFWEWQRRKYQIMPWQEIIKYDNL